MHECVAEWNCAFTRTCLHLPHRLVPSFPQLLYAQHVSLRPPPTESPPPPLAGAFKSGDNGIVVNGGPQQHDRNITTSSKSEARMRSTDAEDHCAQATRLTHAHTCHTAYTALHAPLRFCLARQKRLAQTVESRSYVLNKCSVCNGIVTATVRSGNAGLALGRRRSVDSFFAQPSHKSRARVARQRDANTWWCRTFT
jgi:hypothetical protein